MKLKFFFLAVLYNSLLNAQVGIGTTTPKGALDVTSTTNGFLPPRVALTALNVTTPIVNPAGGAVAVGTIVWNTVTASSGLAAPPNSIAPGLYYWDGAKWVAFTGGTGGLDWSLNGNANTSSASNFIGTTDNVDLIFKRSGINSGALKVLNTSFGVNSLNITSSGTNNVAYGNDNLVNNTFGAFNTSIGSFALNKNTTGSTNIAMGGYALNKNTTGDNNSAIGYFALRDNTTGSSNIAIGINALLYNTTASFNTAIGISALQNNTTGTSNVSVGLNTLKSNTTGNSNVVIGDSSQQSSTTGSNNTSIGNWAMVNNLTGSNNTSVGNFSLSSLTSGNFNIGIGNLGGGNVTTGSNNIGIGRTTSFADPTASFQLNIGNNIFGTGLNGNWSAPAGNIGIGNSAPNSKLQVAGPISTAVNNYKSTDPTTLTITDAMSVIIFDANCTITLPNPTACAGRQLTFLLHNNPTAPLLTSTTNILSSTGVTTTNIAGTSGNTCIIVSDGTNWNIVN